MKQFFKHAIFLTVLSTMAACGGGGSSTPTVPPVQNTAPVANAGPDQNSNTGAVITLNASASSDANGDTLTYQWSISSTPSGSNAALNSSTASMPTFTADIDGTYVFQLIVNDGRVNSPTDTINVVATTPNSAPVSNAGINQNINTGAIVTLNGTASSDIDGDSLTYQWVLSVPMGSTAGLNDNTLPSPTFTADIDGTYSAQLTVNDGTVNSPIDSVDIVATTLNSAPVANPGLAQNVNTGNLVTLDGSASSDADGDNLSYQWTLVAPTNSVASLNDITAVSPTFTADLDGNYVVELTVNDGTIDSSGVSVTITATTANSAPMANAGSDQNALVNDIVTLNGDASTDADGDSLTYQWSLLSVPSGSTVFLTNPSASLSSFSPDLAGTYTAQLIVNDGEELSAPDTINVVVTVPNTPPIANAGPDQSITTGTLVTLSGSGIDANGDSLTYQWSVSSSPSGSNAPLSNSAIPTPTFSPDIDGTYVFQLIVNDGTDDSSADSVSFIATTPNVAPIANSGVDQSVNTGSLVSLNGNASSDADNDSLTYSWILTVPAGSSASLNDAAAVAPTFTADIDGIYTVQLIVNDGVVDSVADTSTITASTPNSAPVANAGTDQNINTGNLATLDGSASSDSNGDSLTYQWVLNVPMGSVASLNDSAIASPTFTADVDGTYSAQLIVNDGVVDSPADIVDIVATTVNTAPVAAAGFDQNVNTLTLVTLNGNASSDADGDNLSYQWTLVSVPADSIATLNNASSASPTFTPDKDGSYVVQLIVNDGTENSVADSVTIEASTPNTAPVANAGINQNINTGALVMLDGTASSDINGDSLTYLWVLSAPVGSAATLSNSAVASPTFTADIDGTYTAQLVVNDGEIDSPLDTVNIVATTVNSAPIANAGIDQGINTGSTVILNGSASTDANGDNLSYQWVLVSVPTDSTATLNDSSFASPTFVADKDGSYIAELTVNDGIIDSASDTVTIVASTANSAPTANAGIDQNVVTNNVVTLDGSLSSDDDGDVLTYQWSLLSAPSGNTATLNNATNVETSFTPNVEGTYTAQLIVNDAQESSLPNTINILVSFANSAPVANAGTDQFVTPTTQVSLDGSGSTDANGDMLLYTWSFVSIPVGSGATFDNNQVSQPSFVADVNGSYVVSLSVSDGMENSLADTMQVLASNNTVSLTRKVGPFGNTFEDVVFPYSSSIFLNTDDESTITLNTFRIVAQGTDFTITNLQAVNLTNELVPFFTTISDGFVLNDSVSVEFDLVSPLTNGEQLDLRYSFEIEETGQVFFARYRLTTSN